MLKTLGDIAYKEVGQGETTWVWIHGFCEDSEIWAPLWKALPNRRHIGIDLSGFGRSISVPDPTIDDYADNVISLIVEKTEGPVVLVGHSLGGYVLSAVAEVAPELIDGWVMFHSHPYEDPEDKKAGRLKNIAFIEEHGVPLFAKQLIPNLFTPEFVAANPKMIKELVDRASKCAKRGVVGALQAMLERTDRSDAFKRLETPMLFIVGEKETVVPKDLSISQTKLAAASQLVMLPKENHMGMVSSVEESATAIMNFEKVLSLHI